MVLNISSTDEDTKAIVQAAATRQPGRKSDDGDVAGLGRRRAAVFVAPALILISLFLVFPAVWTLYLGLTNFRLTGPQALNPQFVGLQNYVDAVSNPKFLSSLSLTLAFVFGSAIVGQSLLGFAIAWMMTRVNRIVRSIVEFFGRSG